MKKTNKSGKGGFGEYTPEGIAKKKLQDKRDEKASNSADNEPKDCGCCWYRIRLNGLQNIFLSERIYSYRNLHEPRLERVFAEAGFVLSSSPLATGLVAMAMN